MTTTTAPPTTKKLALLAAIAGLAYTVTFAVFETRHFGVPKALSLFGDTDTLSVFHYPVIWLLSSLLLFAAIFAVVTIRHHRVRKHTVRFSLSCVVAAGLTLFYILPQIGTLTVPADPDNPCTASSKPTANPVVIEYSGSGFCPVRVTVTSGATIKFVDDRSTSMQIASDEPELNQKQQASTFTVTLTKQGTFLYTDDISTGASLHKLFSQLLGNTQSHQGVIRVTAAGVAHGLPAASPTPTTSSPPALREQGRLAPS